MDDYGENVRLSRLNSELEKKYKRLEVKALRVESDNARLKEPVAKLQSELSSLKAASCKTKSNAYKVGITKEVLQCYLAEGLSVKEIAGLYSVAPNTIRNRMSEFRLKGVLPSDI